MGVMVMASTAAAAEESRFLRKFMGVSCESLRAIGIN
jgi:hypothetical protein